MAMCPKHPAFPGLHDKTFTDIWSVLRLSQNRDNCHDFVMTDKQDGGRSRVKNDHFDHLTCIFLPQLGCLSRGTQLAES